MSDEDFAVLQSTLSPVVNPDSEQVYSFLGITPSHPPPSHYPSSLPPSLLHTGLGRADRRSHLSSPENNAG